MLLFVKKITHFNTLKDQSKLFKNEDFNKHADIIKKIINSRPKRRRSKVTNEEDDMKVIKKPISKKT